MIYDIIIVGGGPAGLTAAIYALRAKKHVLLIERYTPGGQVATTSIVENYPGFESIDGFELSQRMFNQAEKLGLEVVYSDVTLYDFSQKVKKISTFDGNFEAKSVIIATGAVARELEVDNEKQYVSRGVSYCAKCDGNFFRDMEVAVVGGGNTSIEDCVYLSGIVKKIYLIHRRDELRGNAELLKPIEDKIEYVFNSTVKELKGDGKLESIVVEDKISKKCREIKVPALFVAIGRRPDTNLLRDVINMDASGFILTDENMHTNVEGVFACGDVRQKRLRQIVTACADGAIAAVEAIGYIAKI